MRALKLAEFAPARRRAPRTQSQSAEPRRDQIGLKPRLACLAEAAPAGALGEGWWRIPASNR
jgi:hypothetical protein